MTIGTLPSALRTAPGPELPALPLVAALQPSEVKGHAWLPSATLAVIEPTGPPPASGYPAGGTFEGVPDLKSILGG